MDGHWEPRNENGRRHSCLKRKRNYEAPLDLTKTFCATCLRSINSMQNYVCSCISPVYVSKEQAKYIKNERKNEENEKYTDHIFTNLELICNFYSVRNSKFNKFYNSKTSRKNTIGYH